MRSGTTAFRRAQWRMLLATMFCYLFFYTGRQTVGFAIPGIHEELGISLPQLAIGWLLRIPQLTSVITGASCVEHLEENLKAADVVELLTPEILERIETILDNKPQPEE